MSLLPGTQDLTAYSGDIKPLIEAAISALPATGGRVMLPNGVYTCSDTIVLPQEAPIDFVGQNRDVCRIVSNFAKPIFAYDRGSGKKASNFNFRDMSMQLSGNAQTPGSSAIHSYGYNEAASENSINVNNCAFYGFEDAIDSKFTGRCHIEDSLFMVNLRSIDLLRGCSFWWFTGNLSFDRCFVRGTDTIHDAFSNALFFEGCSNVTGLGSCIDIEGWQAIWMDKCGWDLGSAGVAAVYLKSCTDVNIENSYISSDGVANRYGVYATGSVRLNILNNTIVNNMMGVQVVGTSGLATRANIQGNFFDGNATNDVFLNANATCCKVTNNHCSKQMSRTGTNYEIYANTAGANYNIIKENTFKGSSYSIVSGANSIIADNIFGVTAG